MKRLLLLICLIFAIGCSKSDDGISKTKDSGLMFYSYEKYKLNTGEEKEKDLDFEMVRIWDANGKDFDFEKSGTTDVLEGYLWDKKTNKSHQSIDLKLGGSHYITKLNQGKYVIFILYKANKNYTQSYSEFEVKDDYIKIKKYFKPRVVGNLYAEW